MIPTARSGWVLALDVLDLTGGTHPLAGDVGPGIEIGGDSVKKPGPRNLSCSGRARQHRGGGNRRTSKKQRSRHNTNITTHLRVPSGRQVPHVLQEEGTEDGVRLLRSPTPPTIADPWGPLSSMLSRNKDSGGGGIQAPRWSSGPGSRSHSPLTGGKSTVSVSTGISGPSLSASRTRPP